MFRPPRPRFQQVDSDVFLIRGRLSNWVILYEDKALTVIDTGHRQEAALMQKSLAMVAARTGAQRVEALLLTHIHDAHAGSIGLVKVLAEHNVRILTSTRERSSTPTYSESAIGEQDGSRRPWHSRPIRRLWRPGQEEGIARADLNRMTSFEDDSALDVPGRPIPIPSPGHTLGHTAFFLPHQELLISGDAMVSTYPGTGHYGPQTLPAQMNDDNAAAQRTMVALLAVPAELYLPGHGPVGNLRNGRGF